MKKIFYLCISIGLLFAQPDFDGLESEVNSAEISVGNLDKKDMKAVSKKENELLLLKKKLENIKAKLDKDHILENLKLNSFSVKLKAAYDEKDKSKDISSDSFRQGDILEFSSMIEYPKLEEKATTTIQWQLFDGNDKAIKNYFKEKDFDLINTSKTHKFKIRLGQTLDSGQYTVALSHFLKQNDKISYQAVKSFEIKQDIKIINLQLSNSPTDTKNRTRFYNDEKPHMYANFKLSPNTKKVTVAFNAVNQKGKVLYEYEGQRERKGESQRAGIKISDLKVGDRVTFNAFITGNDGYEISQSKSFKVINYPMDINANFTNILHNGSRRFSLKVPKVFEKPYDVKIVQSKLYDTSINSSTLRGTLSAKNDKEYNRTDYIKIIVIDSVGRQAVNVHGMSINAKEKEVEKVVQKIIVPKPTIKEKNLKIEPVFVDTSKPIKKSTPKPKKYTKTALTQNQKIALGEKRYRALFNNFNKVIPSCYQSMNVSSELSKISTKGKETFGTITTISSLNKFKKESFDYMVNINIKHNIIPNFYKNDKCAIKLLNNLKRSYPNASISPYSYSQLSKKMTAKKQKVNNNVSRDILKCKNDFKKYKGFLKNSGYYSWGGSFAISNDGRFCGMSNVAYSGSNRMQASMNVALGDCNSIRKSAGVSGSCSIIHKTIKPRK